MGIDDATLETYAKWSEWRRSLHAQAINNLSTAGARVIGFDFLYLAPGTTAELIFACRVCNRRSVNPPAAVALPKSRDILADGRLFPCSPSI